MAEVGAVLAPAAAVVVVAPAVVAALRAGLTLAPTEVVAVVVEGAPVELEVELTLLGLRLFWAAAAPNWTLDWLAMLVEVMLLLLPFLIGSDETVAELAPVGPPDSMLRTRAFELLAFLAVRWAWLRSVEIIHYDLGDKEVDGEVSANNWLGFVAFFARSCVINGWMVGWRRSRVRLMKQSRAELTNYCCTRAAALASRQWRRGGTPEAAGVAVAAAVAAEPARLQQQRLDEAQTCSPIQPTRESTATSAAQQPGQLHWPLALLRAGLADWLTG